MSIKDTLDSIADAIREKTGKTELMTMAQMPDEIRSIMITNPNLLDNWYFGNPVNQRGVTSWSGGYGIDRWIATVPASCANGKIQITESGSFYQRIENVAQYFGRVMTISALLDGGTLLTGTWTLQNSNKNIVISEHLVLSYNTGYQFLFYARDNSAPAIIAVKVELGSQQTLAHQENGVWVLNEIPNYAEELRKCQRFYQQIKCVFLNCSNSSVGYAKIIPFSAEMRVVPTYTATLVGLTLNKQTGSSVTTINTVYGADTYGSCMVKLTDRVALSDHSIMFPASEIWATADL